MESTFSASVPFKRKISRSDLQLIDALVKNAFAPEFDLSKALIGGGIHLTSQQQSFRFDSIQEVLKNFSQSAPIDECTFVFLLDSNCRQGAFPDISVTLSYTDYRHSFSVHVTAPSPILAEDLSVKICEDLQALPRQSKKGDKPDKADRSKSKKNVRKQFYRSPVFWAAVAALGPLAVWIIDRFVLGV